MEGGRRAQLHGGLGQRPSPDTVGVRHGLSSAASRHRPSGLHPDVASDCRRPVLARDDRAAAQALVSMKLTVVKQRLSLPASPNVALIAAGLLLGLALVIRWQEAPTAPTDVSGARERAAQAVEQLEREQEELKNTIAGLRDELATVQRQASQNTDLLTRISTELERERAAAGLVALQGPGVVVQLDDSNKAASASGTAAEDYLIHEFDLRDVVSLLWAGGAEAIAVNDERLVHTTSIYCVGSTVMVNDTRLSPPYVVRAIGERGRLEPLLENPAFLSDLRRRGKAYGVQFKVTWANQVDIPAYSGTLRVRAVHTGEVTP